MGAEGLLSAAPRRPAFAASRAAAASPVDSALAAGGLKFRAFMRAGSTPKIDMMTLDPLAPHRVLVKTQACSCCYSIVTQAQARSDTAPYAVPRILGHGGVGTVVAVGDGVRRVRPGDRVIVPNTPQCGDCYNCIRGRADLCKMRGFASELLPIGKLADGSPVTQHNNEGGIGEYMTPFEEYCVPTPSKAPADALAMIACNGACGLGLGLSLTPIRAGANVIVFGCGPVGLSVIQAARIAGAANIVAIEPVPERLAMGLRMGATVGLDPRAEGAGLVARIKTLTRGWTQRPLSGSRSVRDFDGGPAQVGGDFVFECVGGDRGTTSFPTRSPDPTGIVPLTQAWQVTAEGGVCVTPSVAQQGNVSFDAADWAGGGRTHVSSQFCGVQILRDIPRFVSLYEQGQYDADGLVTMRVPLDDVQRAFQAVADRTTVGAITTFM